MVHNKVKEAAIILFLIVMIIPFGCERGEEELVVADDAINENQVSLKSISLSGIYPVGMVAYWKFEEGSGTTTIDCINGHVGNLNNGPEWISGIVGKGVLFNGINAVIEVPYHPDFNPGNQFTLEAWGYLYGSGDKNHDTFISKMSLPSQEFIVSYQFWVSVGDWLAVDYKFSDGWQEFYTSSDIFELNKWNHVVFSKNQNELKLYYNGQLVKTGFEFNNFPQTEGNLGIGANYEGWGSFNGIIDEVAIYNRALPIDEIQQHYQNGLNGLGYENQAVQAAVDINPNKINLKRNAKMVTVFIELPDGYNVADIDISTIKLEKAIYAEAHPFSLGDYDNDNIPDLMVKFDARALSEYLDGTIGEVILSINGEFYDGSLFEGNDIITFF